MTINFHQTYIVETLIGYSTTFLTSKKTLKVASILKIYVKYCDCGPHYYGKQFIVYHTLYV